jgi:pimeloyl-ACP methyl ester carboxylesterase
MKGHAPVTETALAPRDRLVDTPKGDVFTREVPGEGTPIVLLHGFPDDHKIYDRLSPLLNPNIPYRCTTEM